MNMLRNAEKKKESCVHLQSQSSFFMTEQHFTEVVGSEEFLNLGMEQVSSLIASDKLTIPTEEKVHTHPAQYTQVGQHVIVPDVLKVCLCILLCRFLRQ